MKKTIIKTAIAAVFCLFVSVFASDQDDFCRGFAEGYKIVKGDMAIVPICPIAPITPIGSTPYREGIKAGMAAANRR